MLGDVGVRRGALQWRNEAIALPWKCFDETWACRGVTQGQPDLADTKIYALAGVDIDRIAPDMAANLFARDNPKPVP